jgi:hypothetical protein
MATVIFDFGNAYGKWFVPRTNQWGDFVHAIAPLSDNAYNRLGGAGWQADGIVQVNGTAFAVGDAARRHTIRERPTGAARYTDMYYGTALAYTLAVALGRSDDNVTVYASHAPRDQRYAKVLQQIATKKWTVEYKGQSLVFNVQTVRTFDEPLGGFAHYSLTEKGEERKNNKLRNVTTLVIDVGGYTTDVAPIDAGGVIDIAGLNSTEAGVINLTRQFEQELRDNNPTRFQDVGDIDVRRIEDAIRTGVYKFGKIQIDCRREAEAAINALVNDIRQVIRAAGGIANYDKILVTGGGGALMYDPLVKAVDAADFLLAESNRELMKYANVFGGAKIAKLMRAMHSQ